VIVLGTPGGAGLLWAGDTVEVSIEGVGELKNGVTSD